MEDSKAGRGRDLLFIEATLRVTVNKTSDAPVPPPAQLEVLVGTR